MALGTLANPPIREAIISVSFLDIVPFEKLQNFQQHTYVREHYPERRSSIAVQVEGSVEEADLKQEKIPYSLSATHQLDGFILAGKEEGRSKVIQTKIGQFSFHLLKCYKSWDSFLEEFKRLWSIFCDVVGQTHLRQMSLRYVNEIEIPLPMEEGFGAYLRLLPQLPDGIGNVVDTFFLQLNMPNETGTLNSIITETFVTESEQAVKVLLDINVRKSEETQCNSTAMWEGLEEMRAYKNLLFERCLTPKALQNYE